MNSDLTKTIYHRIFRSVGADSLGQVINTLMRIVLIPLFLTAWGAQTYGEWLIITAFAAWIGFGDLGGQLYYVNRLTAEWATGKLDEFQKVYSTGLFTFLAAMILLFALVLFLIAAFPVGSWLNFQRITNAEISLVLLLMTLRFLIALPMGLLLGLYRAIGAQATSVMYGNLILLIQFCASVCALYFNAGVVTLAAVEIFPVLIAMVIIYWRLPKMMPKSFRLFHFKMDLLVFKEAISPSLHFLSMQISNSVIIQGSILVLAGVLGSIDVALFSSLRVVSNVVARFLGIVGNAAWPEITRLSSNSENEKLSNLFSTVLYLTLMFGFSYLFIIVNFGETLFNYWLQHKLHYDFWVMYLLICQVVISSLLTWGGNILMATNKHEEFARWQFIINMGALLAIYIGAKMYGLTGAVAGLVIGQVIPVFYVTIYLLGHKGFPILRRETIKIILVTLALLPFFLNVWSGFLALSGLAIYLINLKKKIIWT